VESKFTDVGPVFVIVTVPVPVGGSTPIPVPATICVTPPPPPPPPPPETKDPFNNKVAPLTVKKFRTFVSVSKNVIEDVVMNPVLMVNASNELINPTLPNPRMEDVKS
jgi:hypothetical protein